MRPRRPIPLPADEHRRARARAVEFGVSVVEHVRRLVRRDLGAGRAASDRHALFDLGESRGSDVARHKDDYIGAAVESVS